MLGEHGLEGVEMGGESSFREIVDAFMPVDDIRQRTDLSERDVQALTVLGYFAVEYNCRRFEKIIAEYMNLRRSVDRKSSKEVRDIVNAMLYRYRVPDEEGGDNKKMEEMLDE
jgi:hypothetical protein